jgi:hypothetical protein
MPAATVYPRAVKPASEKRQGTKSRASEARGCSDRYGVLPSQLRDIAYQNKRVIYDLLMKASAETTLAIAADPKRLGAKIGITAVLHTWGSAMTHHPHVHMIVPGGGLSEDGNQWVAAPADFLVHVNVLASLFRGKMLAMLSDAHAAGQPTFFNSHAGLADKKTFKRFLAPLRHIDWVVYCKPPFAGPKQVLRYLSRYTHRVAISNQRLVAADDGGVSFRWKDYRIEGPERWKTMTLATIAVRQRVTTCLGIDTSAMACSG